MAGSIDHMFAKSLANFFEGWLARLHNLTSNDISVNDRNAEVRKHIRND